MELQVATPVEEDDWVVLENVELSPDQKKKWKAQKKAIKAMTAAGLRAEYSRRVQRVDPSDQRVAVLKKRKLKFVESRLKDVIVFGADAKGADEVPRAVRTAKGCGMTYALELC